MVNRVDAAPTQVDRALRAEAMMWDYERDFMPPGLEVVERDELLMWRRASGPASEQRWANRVSFVRTRTSEVDRLIDEALSFFGSLPLTWIVGLPREGAAL